MRSTLSHWSNATRTPPNSHAPPLPCVHRLFLISQLPRLKLLDFERVRDSEKAEAEAAFGGAEGEARSKALAAVSHAAAAAEEATASVLGGDEKRTTGPSPAQLLAIKAAIASASTLDEVQRLEKALQAGVMPSELAANGQHGTAAMEEG